MLDDKFGRENRGEETFEKFVRGYGLNRDPQRSPMRWDSSETDGSRAANRGCRWATISILATCSGSRQIVNRCCGCNCGTAKSGLCIRDYHPRRSRNNFLVFERHYYRDRLPFALNTVNHPGDANGPERDSLADNGSRLYQIILEGPFLLRVNEGTIKLNE